MTPEQKIRGLNDMIIAYAKATEMQTEALMSVLTMLMYRVATSCALVEGISPTEKLRTYIEIMEDSFGEYLKDPHVVAISAMVRGRPR